MISWTRRLQWGRAWSSAERSITGQGYFGIAFASMGPRLVERGKSRACGTRSRRLDCFNGAALG